MKVVKTHRSKTAKISEEQYERFRPDVLRLAAEKGDELTSQDIIEAAKDPSISFHEFIYRDSDTEAARKWRLVLARDIVQSFHVTFIDSDGDEAEGKEFTSVKVVFEDETYDAYVTTSRAVKTIPYTNQMIPRCLAELKAMEKRYGPFLDKGKTKPVLAALRALISLIEKLPEIKKLSKAA